MAIVISEFLRDSWKEFVGGFIGFWVHHVHLRLWHGALTALARKGGKKK